MSTNNHLAVMLALLALVPALPAQDWPQFRGPTGMGTSTETSLPTTWSDDQGIAWKVALPGPGTSSPILVGANIYLTYYTGYNEPGRPGNPSALKLHLLALDRRTGKVHWDRDINPTLPEQPTIREGHGYASSTPAADADRIYCFFGKSGVVAFDHDGKPLWRTGVGTGLNGWGSGASIALHGNLVLVNASVESESLIALDKKTGKEVWRVSGIRESWCMPVAVTAPDGKTELIVAIQGQLLGLDPKTGKQLWTCDTDITWYMVPSVVAADGVVYALGGRSGVVGLAVKAGGRGDVTRTHRLWTSRKGSNVTSPIVHDGHLYWMNDNLGTAYCASAATGEIAYEQRVPGAVQVYASAVLADRKLYYLARNGRTFVLAAKPTYELLATNVLSDRSTFNASPAVAGGRFYLRSDKYLYCIGGK
jgi:outer membrane protein assembly factor BamB